MDPGGADQRAQVRRPRARLGDRPLEGRRAGSSRSRTTAVPRAGGDGRGHGLRGVARAGLARRRLDRGPVPEAGGGFVVEGAPSARWALVTTRVLVGDDQLLVRAGGRMILEAEPEFEVVGEAGDGLEAGLAARRASGRTSMLMDVRMPKVDGLEATRGDRGEASWRPAVLVLTTFDLDEYVYEALRAGASGFLLKDTPPELLGEGDSHRRDRRGTARAGRKTRRVIADFVRRPPAAGAAQPAGNRRSRRGNWRFCGSSRAGRSNGEIAARPSSARDGEDVRRHGSHEAAAPRPRPGRRLRLRARDRAGGRSRRLSPRTPSSSSFPLLLPGFPL